MSKRKYWYKTYKEVCGECRILIGQSRRRVYEIEERGIVVVITPQCDYCYRVMKGV